MSLVRLAKKRDKTVSQAIECLPLTYVSGMALLIVAPDAYEHPVSLRWVLKHKFKVISGDVVTEIYNKLIARRWPERFIRAEILGGEAAYYLRRHTKVAYTGTAIHEWMVAKSRAAWREVLVADNWRY